MSTGPDAHVMAPVMEPSAAMAAAPPGTPGAEAETTGMGAGEVWRVVKQRKLLVILSFIVFSTIAVGITVAVYIWLPTYSSEAMLELLPPRQDVYSPLEGAITHKDVMERQLETEASKVKHLSLLQSVLAQPEVKETYFYRWYEGDFATCLYELQELVNSSPVRDTNLIRVRLTIRYASEARLIVNKIVQTYMAQYGDIADESIRRKEEALRDTLAEAEDALRAKRTEIQQFRETSDVPALETKRTSLIDTISALTNQINALTAEAADAQAQLDSVEGRDPRSLPVTPEMKIIVEADPILRYRRERVESMEVRIEAMSRANLLGENHRQRILLEAERDGYARKEMARREELLDDLRARQLEQLRQNLARIRSVKASLHEQLQEAETKRRELDRNLQRFESMVADEKRLEEGIKRLEGEAMTTKHYRTDPSRVRLRIVQLAEEANQPTRPKFSLYLGAGFALSLLCAVGLAFLREFTDKAVRTPIDVARHGRLSVLGCIPLLDDEEADVDEIELATRRAPHSLVAEAFRQVRTNLLFSGPIESQRTLLVTSPGPEDGKTATAINLAVTLAHGNERVLLVDCNFRRPAIRTAFADTRPEGLSNILIGQAKLDEVVTATDLPNLHVLTSGPMPPRPAELLGGQYMRALLEEAAKKYDRVVFDGPPVLLISDALVISKLVDSVVVVARAVSNSKGALKRAREQLARINAHVVGAILNGVEARSGGYYRQQYREFYEYTSEETIPQQLPGAAFDNDEPVDDDEDDNA